MCGIAGIVDWETDLNRAQPELEAMGGALAPRGPDAGGFWLSDHAAFVHRRLIVIDPEGGAQPMVRREGLHPFVLNYNGELYNTAELRSELESFGHRFSSRSDTEVLLVSYIHWGSGCVDHLNGIFAFAVWDDYNQSIFLARDRLGVKPLFYVQRGMSLAYASELKGLLASARVEPVLDAGGLAEIFVMGPSRTPGHGIFRGIKELRPGCSLTYSRRGPRVRRYWCLESHEHPDDAAATAARVRELLEDTVERQLVSDVPVCVLLSGGLDSGAVTAFAAAARQKAGLGALSTYSVDFAGNELYFKADDFQTNRDDPWVDKVSRLFATTHQKVVLDTPELVEGLPSSLIARDHPGMGDVDTSLLLFCRKIKEKATVAVSGEAADEIFGGYPWFHLPQELAAKGFPWIRRVKERLGLLSRDLVEHIRAEEYLADRYRDALAEVPRLAGEDAFEARMRDLLYLNITRFLATLLDRKDRMSMAVGLEVRVPFCDHRLVEYVWNIPWSMKKCGGMPKGILRLALEGVLPVEIVSRRKSPYPSTHNPTYLKACRSWFLQLLDDPASPLAGLLDPGQARALTAEDTPFAGQPWFSQLMGLPQLFSYYVQLDFWLRRYRIRLA
ncbi:MAG: asparagine synthase (glutamine-hydrolyzing) [Peptococcaceae bacterium]|jgi:asparagine synthase (glutamine-hydrolysing)|nr:asparagine synthase (glutamine-hydrolyzing) [Peptococcaceae bacterium]